MTTRGRMYIERRDRKGCPVYQACAGWLNFERIPTAGGYTALYHPCDDGGLILITSGDPPDAPADDARVVDVGRYDHNADPCYKRVTRYREGQSLDIDRIIGLPASKLGAWIKRAFKRGRAKSAS